MVVEPVTVRVGVQGIGTIGRLAIVTEAVAVGIDGVCGVIRQIIRAVEAADAVFILGEDLTNAAPRIGLALRQSARPAHLARIQQLVDQGRLLAAGPHPALDTEEPGDAGFTGSLIIGDFDSLEAATAWADSDPYVDAGVFSKVTVKPYKLVLP